MVNLEDDKFGDLNYQIGDDDQIRKDLFDLDDVTLDLMDTPAKVGPQPATTSGTPKWLTSSVNKKQSLIPVSIIVQDIVSKYA